MDFLQDRNFLQSLNQYHIQSYSAAIMLLNFETEMPITRLEGKVISGSMSITANSPTRRTGSMQVVFDKDTFDLTNIDNLISINKKISLSIGIANPYYNSSSYAPNYFAYGDILWFKQGVFIITSASSSISLSSATISINFIDKMGLLNGVASGTLPAQASLHDRIEVDKDDNVTTTYPLINQIIRETVHHFGNEQYSRIIVDDVPDFGRQVVRWAGSTPIRFTQDRSAFIVSNSTRDGFSIPYYENEDIGYMSTDLTYPGEFIVKAGATVTTILDEIVKTLGNFEYFYDVDGFFHFQQIRNFDKTGITPIVQTTLTDTNSPLNINPLESFDAIFQDRYIPKFADDQFLNEFEDSSLVTSVSFNPDYANIKNDFVIWGSRKDNSNDTRMVRYHLAIDKRPEDIGSQALCRKWFWCVKDIETQITKRYISTDSNSAPSINPGEEVKLHSSSLTSLPGGSGFDWREELYRQGLLGWNNASEGTYYDEELLTEWRKIFNPNNEIFSRRWQEHYGSLVPFFGYTIDVVTAPETIHYWLDIIDTSTPLGAYSVQRIGRRSVVKENNKINEVISKEIPDIIFIDDTDTSAEGRAKVVQAMKDYISIGQAYCLVQPEFLPYFTYRNSFGTCYEEVRELFYKHLIYNTKVNLTCIPLFHLDVNRVVRLNFPDLGIVGNYVLNNISWNLGNLSTMNIAANEAVVII